MLRGVRDGKAEFTLISLWESWGAIKGFAEPHCENAVCYPKDEKFLLAMQPHVDHEVLNQPL